MATTAGTIAATARATTATTATTGESLPAGYTITVDGGAAQPIGPSATVTLTNLAVGAHAVELAGVPANCTVAGQNPRSLDVSAGGTAETTFAVTCTAVTGSLRITTRTTGSGLDGDGYDLSVDGGSGPHIGINASRTLYFASPPGY